MINLAVVLAVGGKKKCEIIEHLPNKQSSHAAWASFKWGCIKMFVGEGVGGVFVFQLSMEIRSTSSDCQEMPCGEVGGGVRGYCSVLLSSRIQLSPRFTFYTN